MSSVSISSITGQPSLPPSSPSSSSPTPSTAASSHDYYDSTTPTANANAKHVDDDNTNNNNTNNNTNVAVKSVSKSAASTCFTCSACSHQVADEPAAVDHFINNHCMFIFLFTLSTPPSSFVLFSFSLVSFAFLSFSPPSRYVPWPLFSFLFIFLLFCFFFLTCTPFRRLDCRCCLGNTQLFHSFTLVPFVHLLL